MTGAQTGFLVVALSAPVMALVATGGRRGGLAHRFPSFRVAQVAALVAAGAWLALVAGAAQGHVSGFHVTPLVAAGGCGAALLTIAALERRTGSVPERRTGSVPERRTGGRSVPALCAALGAVSLGLAAGRTGGETVAVVAGLTLAAVLTMARPASYVPSGTLRPTKAGSGRLRRPNLVPAVVAAAGVVACAVGFFLVHSDSGAWSLPTTGPVPRAAIVALLAGAALLAACGTLGLRSGTEPALRSGTEPGALLVAGGLVIGLSAALARVGATELGAAVVALGAAAVAAAGVRRGSLSLALLALAAAAGPAALAPGSRLLAAAAVIAAAVDRPWAWLAAVPGAVSLATGVVDDGSRLAIAAALGAAAVAVVLAQAAAEEGLSTPVLPVGILPAVGVGSWLVVAPGTWTWTGATLGAYDQGMARAAAAGLLAVVVAVLVGARRARPATAGVPKVAERPTAPDRPPRPPAQLVPSGRSASTPRPRRATRSQRARPLGRVVARPPKGARRSRSRRPRPPKA